MTTPDFVRSCRKESAVKADGGEQIHLQILCQFLVGEHFESAAFVSVSADLFTKMSSPPPLAECNRRRFGTTSSSDIRLIRRADPVEVSLKFGRGIPELRGAKACFEPSFSWRNMTNSYPLRFWP